MIFGDDKHYIILRYNLYDMLEAEHGELPEFIIKSNHLDEKNNAVILHNKKWFPDLYREPLIDL